MAMSAQPANELHTSIDDNCGKVRHYQSGFAVPGMACGKSSKSDGRNRTGSGSGGKQKWCTTAVSSKKIKHNEMPSATCKELYAHNKGAVCAWRLNSAFNSSLMPPIQSRRSVLNKLQATHRKDGFDQALQL